MIQLIKLKQKLFFPLSYYSLFNLELFSTTYNDYENANTVFIPDLCVMLFYCFFHLVNI
jgi:hypothetical protein